MPTLIPASQATAEQLAGPRPRTVRTTAMTRGDLVARSTGLQPEPTFDVRMSERKAYKRCNYKWLWGYKQGLKPLRESNPLWFGQLVHIALAEWYRPGKERGPLPAETFGKIVENSRMVRLPDPEHEREKAEYIDAVELGKTMLTRYVEQWGTDQDWEIIQPEMSFQVWFPHPTDPTIKQWARIVGTFDGVLRYVGPTNLEMAHGDIWLLENKTAASIQLHHLPLDDQAGSYWALAGEVLTAKGILQPGEEIAGIMYNFLRKAGPDERPVNELGQVTNKPEKAHYLKALTDWAKKDELSREMPSAKMTIPQLEAAAKAAGITVLGDASKVQPAPYFERIAVYRSRAERETMLQRIRDEALHIESARSERPLLPLIKNPTRDCSWDCDFERMCQLHEAGEDWEEFRDIMFKQWNPYEDHEIKAA